MRILFVNPPWIKHKDNIWNNVACVMPPLGLAWMAAVLEGQGHEVRILDAHAERVDLEHFPDRFKELGKFEMVGITATTPLISHAYEISRMVKEQQP
ncbi:MAG: cobalamin B12-binding domain-containing protein, partial [Planctomycetes bacterium]|nr:cobalamin B12-binding domain-containing protein [Planctomycetota bacterium]